MKSTSSKLQPPFKITWRWNTKGRGQYDLDRQTYEDVITLAVKHLGMGIRPNAFAMLACAQCFGGKEEGRNELEHIRWKEKKRRISSAESAGVCKQTHKELFPLDLILLTAAGFVFCSSLMNAY